MFTITTNLPHVAAFLGRLDEGYGAAVVDRLGALDPNLFRAAAQGALTAAMLPEEFPWLIALLETVSVALPGAGRLQVAMGRPPTLLERARYAAEQTRRMFAGGRRPAYLGKGIGRAEAVAMDVRARGLTPERLAADSAAARDLVRAWVGEPFTDENDPASGKHKDERDAGLGDEEIAQRLEWILGLNPAQAASARTAEMEAAAAALARALGRFAAAQSGPDSQTIPEARLRDLFRAVLAAWRALLLQHLPAAARAAVLDARQ